MPDVAVDLVEGDAFLGAVLGDQAQIDRSAHSENSEKVELCLIAKTAPRNAVDLTEVDAYVWHGYLPTVTPGPALRLPRARPVRPRERAPLQPEQAAARPLRQGRSTATIDWDQSLFGYDSATRTRATTTTTRAATHDQAS